MKKLYKVIIRSYHFGIIHYTLFVLADSEDEAKRLIYECPRYKRDEDARIEDVEEIGLDESKVL